MKIEIGEKTITIQGKSYDPSDIEKVILRPEVESVTIHWKADRGQAIFDKIDENQKADLVDRLRKFAEENEISIHEE